MDASPATRRSIGAILAAAVGLVAWVAFMASAPRYSHPPHEDMGSNIYFWVLLAAAVALGFLWPHSAALSGALLGLPGLVLSPWTAPRGDNDGLWVLIVPLVAIFTVVLVAVAGLGAWLRSKALPSGV